jgi:signal transduction histidine kinase
VLNHQVPLRVRLSPLLPPVLGDRVQLQQVLINLVMNGIQSMEHASSWTRELAIETSQTAEGHIQLAVSDSGAGLDPQHADRLFEAFFSTKPHGMGMGLSICRSIIEAHGGRIHAFNNEGGHGATFQCTLPPLVDAAA